MACLPRDSKYYHSPLTHHQWNVNMGGYGQVFANTSSDGTSRTCTVTVDKKDMALHFLLPVAVEGRIRSLLKAASGCERFICR